MQEWVQSPEGGGFIGMLGQELHCQARESVPPSSPQESLYDQCHKTAPLLLSLSSAGNTPVGVVTAVRDEERVGLSTQRAQQGQARILVLAPLLYALLAKQVWCR